MAKQPTKAPAKKASNNNKKAAPKATAPQAKKVVSQMVKPACKAECQACPACPVNKVVQSKTLHIVLLAGIAVLLGVQIYVSFFN